MISLRRRRKWQLILAEEAERDYADEGSNENLDDGDAWAERPPKVLGSVTIGVRLIEVAFRTPSEPKVV